MKIVCVDGGMRVIHITKKMFQITKICFKYQKYVSNNKNIFHIETILIS